MRNYSLDAQIKVNHSNIHHIFETLPVEACKKENSFDSVSNRKLRSNDCNFQSFVHLAE